MAPVRPMIGDLELEQAQVVATDDEHVRATHRVPALEGDFLQTLGRRAQRLHITGVITAADARAALEKVQATLHGAEPVDFISDITTATATQKVLVEDLQVVQDAGASDRFGYAMTLREFDAAPAPQTGQVDIPPPAIPDFTTGGLTARVVTEDGSDLDFSTVTVQISGTQDDGRTPLERTLTDRANDTWRDAAVPPGSHTVTAQVNGMIGTATATIRGGEQTTLLITLRRTGPVAHRFVVHFRFDSAFVEPCMRDVLRAALDYAAANPGEKLLILGHTDRVGSADYNQALSERRARAVYAMATSATDTARARAEWNELRRPHATVVNDGWGTREYQQILQALGRYHGRIGGDPDLTDAAVKQFQTDSGLGVDGVVGDDTWPKLIEAYLGLDGGFALDQARLLPNCPGTALQWLGAGESDPVVNIDTAERRNRRVELIFVQAGSIPTPVPEPVTLGLNPAGAGGGLWCLDAAAAGRVDFLVPGDPGRAKTARGGKTRWRRVPAAPGTVKPQVTITFDGGAPYQSGPYVLTASDGEFMDGEQRTTAGAVPAGSPLPGHTDAQGQHAYDREKEPGIYTLEVDDEVVARLEGQPLSAARGPVVCANLAAPGQLSVLLTPRAVLGVVPTITGPALLVAPKPHTSPARQALTLKASQAFTGSGLLTRSHPRVQVFSAAAGGTELTFNRTDNVFTAAALAAGVTVFLLGRSASGAVDDTTLTLALTVNGSPGLTAAHKLTVVEFTLAIAGTPAQPGDPPPALEPAPPGRPSVRVAPGRYIQLATPANLLAQYEGAPLAHERARLTIHPPKPAGLTANVELTGLSARTTAWDQELPAAGQVPVAVPLTIAAGAVPAAGRHLWVDGATVSGVSGGDGYQLGLAGIEPDGDRVPMTVVGLDAARTALPAAPPVTTVRFGIWDHAYDAAGNVVKGAAEAANFVGADTRRFHVRLRDVTRVADPDVTWRTLKADRTGDDVQHNEQLTLPQSSPGLFVSRGIMLVTDEVDAMQDMDSGLTAGPDMGNRLRGQSNHRLRRANLDGFVRVEYVPQPTVPVRLPLVLPLFPRAPKASDERRRLPVQVIRYTSALPGYRAATNAYIDSQFASALDRWRQVGLLVTPAPTRDRPVPAGALDPATGLYTGGANTAQEQALLADLIPITLDNTLTVVFIDRAAGGNAANTTVAPRNPVRLPAGGTVTLDNRFFIFYDTAFSLPNSLLGHELFHALFNRLESEVAGAVPDRFFTFNHFVTAGAPDPRNYRRIQNRHARDPDNDLNADNILNWYRRARGARVPALTGPAPRPNVATGNTLVNLFTP